MDARPFPAQQVGAYRPSPALGCRHLGTLVPRVSPGPRSVGVIDTSPTGLSQGSSSAQSKGHAHTKHTQTHATQRWSVNRPPNVHYKSLGQLLFLRMGRAGRASSIRQNSAMTSRALAPNLLTHLGHGRSPVCAASLRPNPCRIRSLRKLLGLQYGLPPSSGAKCSHGRWVFVGNGCMDHVISVRGGPPSLALRGDASGLQRVVVACTAGPPPPPRARSP